MSDVLRSRQRPGLVALDVDGTLVTYEQFYAPPRSAVREAVRAVTAAGAHVVVATGRSLHSTVRVFEHLGLTEGYAVCSNGAVVVDVATHEAVYTETFDATAPVEYFARHVPDAVMAVEDHGVGFRVTGEFPEGELDGTVTHVTHAELLSAPISRLVLRWPGGDPQQFRALAAESGLDSVDYEVGFSAWLDVVPKGVSKASGLEFVCDKLGVDARQVLAIGDGHNDVQMLRWAGHGAAMGQAPDDVRAIADSVLPTVDDDGAAHGLTTAFAL